MTFIKGIASIGAAMLIGLSAHVGAGRVCRGPNARGEQRRRKRERNNRPDRPDFRSSALHRVSLASNPGCRAIILRAGDCLISSTDYIQVSPDQRLSGAGARAFPAAAAETSSASRTLPDGSLIGANGLRLRQPPCRTPRPIDGQTFSSLGATPGTYEWTWGSGANQNFTLVVGAGAIPEPSTWAMMLLGFAGLGFVGYQSAGRRRTACNV